MPLTRRSNNDAALDRILRRSAGAEDAVAAGSCLDVETVAAMADGGLLPHERSAAEAHASTCARCQQLLAAVVRTAPEPPARRAWWRLPAAPWLVPAAAAGLAVALWVAVDVQPPRATVVPVPVPAPQERAPSPPQDSQERLARSPAEANRASARASRDSVPESPLAPSMKSEDPLPTPKRSEQSASARSYQPPAAPPAAAAAETRSPVEPDAKPGSVRERGSSAVPPAPGTPIDSAAGRPFRTDVLADRAAGTVAESFGVATEIASPDPRVRWRITGASLQRSTDGGVTWATQATGTTARLAAGSAPQPEVCWVVGDGGTVLLSIDGLSWQRVLFPIDAALVSVSATGADAATVTASDGRTFVTADRGRTWSRR